MQKLCCRQRAPQFFPTAVLLPSQHKFYQHIRAKMLLITFLPFTLLDSNHHPFAVDKNCRTSSGLKTIGNF